MKNTITHIAAFALLALFTACDSETQDELAIATVSTEIESTELIPEVVHKDHYVYVTAPSGLSLREYNNLDSKKMSVMPYGTKVKVITLEENETMSVGGIKGGMNQVEYNNKTGYAFNGYLSSFFPPEKNSSAKQYIEDLKTTHPNASYTKITGGTASNPTETETVLLPTSKWQEGFTFAQRLFDLPLVFAFPSPKGNDEENITNPKQPDYLFLSKLIVARADNQLQQIKYHQAGEGYQSNITISQEEDMMKIEYVTVIE
ncbi:hypothetical protein SCB49_05375 [unidentified eubacterium SCB49]|nr:hypothetical protein SCB49_05375 [unidentified eubacterium SCB49]